MSATQVTVPTPGRYVVSLSGRFSSGWTGGFTQAVSRLGFNIESGFAARNQRGHWTAEFDLSATPIAADPFTVDFQALVEAPPAAGPLPPLRLHRYSLLRAAGESRVVLTVDAPDQIGFLAALLTPLSMFSLFPVEMTIDTVRAVVHDRFHLRSTAGRAPSDEALLSVRQWLDRCVPMGTASPPGLAVRSRWEPTAG